MNYMLATCHQELHAVLSSLYFLIYCFLFDPHLLSGKHILGMVLSPQLEWHVSARPPPTPNTHTFGNLHAFSNQSAPRFASLTTVARTLHYLTLLSFKHPILDQHPVFYSLTPFSQGTHSTEGFWNKSPNRHPVFKIPSPGHETVFLFLALGSCVFTVALPCVSHYNSWFSSSLCLNVPSQVKQTLVLIDKNDFPLSYLCSSRFSKYLLNWVELRFSTMLFS